MPANENNNKGGINQGWDLMLDKIVKAFIAAAQALPNNFGTG